MITCKVGDGVVCVYDTITRKEVSFAYKNKKYLKSKELEEEYAHKIVYGLLGKDEYNNLWKNNRDLLKEKIKEVMIAIRMEL